MQQQFYCFDLPVQRSHAAHRRWLWQSLETCIVSATGPPTCPPLGAENIAPQESPKSPNYRAKVQIYRYRINNCKVLLGNWNLSTVPVVVVWCSLARRTRCSVWVCCAGWGPFQRPAAPASKWSVARGCVSFPSTSAHTGGWELEGHTGTWPPQNSSGH